MASKKTETKKAAVEKAPAKADAKKGAAKTAAAKKTAAKAESKSASAKKAPVKAAAKNAAKTSAKTVTTKKAAPVKAAAKNAKSAAKTAPAKKAAVKSAAKSSVKSAPVKAAKTVKPAAKAAAAKKPAAKTTTKAAAKTTVKAAAKSNAKAAPAKKAAVKSAAKAATAKKPVAKVTAKSSAKAAPVKKTDTKTAAKTVAKAAAKNAKTNAKPVAKNSAKAANTKTAPAKQEKKTVKSEPAAVKKNTKNEAAPKAVKPENKPAVKKTEKAAPQKKEAVKAPVKEKAKGKAAKANTKVEEPEFEEDDDLLEDEEYLLEDDDALDMFPGDLDDPEREAIQAGFEEKLKTVIDGAKKSGFIDYHEVINAFAVYNLDEEQFDKVWEALDKNRIVLRIDPAEDDIPEEELALEEADEIELDLESLSKDSTEGAEINDPVKMYLKEIGRVHLLSADEEIELAKKMEDGLAVEAKYEELRAKLDIQQKAYDIAKKKKKATKEYATNIDQLTKKISAYQDKVEVGRAAGKELVSANLRLVVSIAKRYVGRGMHFLDLIQEGNLGLMKAVEKFDYRKGYKFSTYATWWIRQAITRAIADQARTIRIPVHMVETINKIIRINRQLLQELGREPSPIEIAERMDMPEERVREILKISQEPVSLETPIGEEEDSHLGDFIQDDNVPIPADAAAQTLLREQLEEILKTLTDRERRVLKLRFGLDDGKQRTLEEVGREFNVTRERIRQIEAKALRKLRHPSRSKRIKDFLE